MRKIFNSFLVIGVVISSLFSSCSDDDEKEEVIKNPELVSFGFYKEDNNGVLAQDYVIDNITSNDISFALPSLVDKTNLIARFETANCETVLVDSDIQESGITSNDFTSPVDYILNNGKNNKKYTVTITKMSDGKWNKLNNYTSEKVTECMIKVNPKTNVPYLVYKIDKEATADESAGVIAYENDVWKQIGDSKASNGRVANVNIDFNAEGVPYIIYSDYTHPLADGKTLQATSLRRLINDSWSDVGNSGDINSIKTAKSAFGFKPDGNPIIVSCAEAASTTDGIARREAIVSDFNGSSWEINKTITGRPSDWNAYLLNSKTHNNAIYFGILDQGSSKSLSAYKYENNTFTSIISGFVPTGASLINIYDFDMNVDNDGNIYLLAADNAPDEGAIYTPHLWKIDAKTSDIKNVGGDINMDLNKTREFALSIAPNGTPFVLYRNASNFPTVVYIDSETKLWSEPTIIEEVVAENLSISFGPAGIGYASFVKTSDKTVSVYKFD